MFRDRRGTAPSTTGNTFSAGVQRGLAQDLSGIFQLLSGRSGCLVTTTPLPAPPPQGKGAGSFSHSAAPTPGGRTMIGEVCGRCLGAGLPRLGGTSARRRGGFLWPGSANPVRVCVSAPLAGRYLGEEAVVRSRVPGTVIRAWFGD